MRKTVLALTAMFALMGAAQASSNLVTDGTFVNGVNGLADWNPSFADPSDSANVQHFSGPDTVFGSSINCTPASSCLAAGPIFGATISQQVATLVPGAYTLSFDIVSSATGPNPAQDISTFGAIFGNALVYSSDTTVIDPWQHVALNVIASAPSTQLSFSFLTPPGAYYLTNVSVTEGALAVPEPQSYAMLLAGLAVLGWAARRRA